MWKFSKAQTGARVEDDRLLRGQGRFVDDFSLDGEAFIHILRSAEAAANFTIDVAAAEAMPGVLLIFTGADVEAAGLGPVCTPLRVPNRDGRDIPPCPWPLMACRQTRYCGEAIAAVIAETPHQARDAAEAIAVSYDRKTPAIAMEQAIRPGAHAVHDRIEDNVSFDWEFGDAKAVQDAFDRADAVASLTLVNNRVIANPLEPRGALAWYDDDDECWMVRTVTQGVHAMRDMIAASLKLDPERLHVVNVDVGGGFGVRFPNYPEYPLTLWAAQRLNRPVRWRGERSDVFLNDTHSRDHLTKAGIALDREGRILAVDVDTLADMGAYHSVYGQIIPTLAAVGVHAGVYDVPALYNRVRGVMTNTAPVDAYRGAGRPEANYATERLLDQAALELGLDRVQIRRRNLRPAIQDPAAAKGDLVPFDSGEFAVLFERALHQGDWAGFENRRRQAKDKGKLRGLGLACYVERTASGQEWAQIRLDPQGLVHVHVGTQSTGQGHETVWAKLISERLGLDDDKVRLHPGDTRFLPHGGGTGGAKSLYMALGALDGAADGFIAVCKAFLAQIWDADENDIAYDGENGDPSFRSRVGNRFMGLFDLAAARRDQGGEALSFEHKYRQKRSSYPYGCHLCEIDVDPDTGAVEIVRYAIADDFGLIVNPMLADGQVHGGVAQGLGQAMGEQAVYSPSGQLLTGSFMDYWMPRASDLPFFEIGYHTTVGDGTPLGVKGCGEAGAIVAAPAYVSAVRDALRDFETKHLDMPVTAEKIWRIVNAQGRAQGRAQDNAQDNAQGRTQG